jgi:hypothetical protein
LSKSEGCGLFSPITIDSFIKDYLKNNPGESKKDIREALTAAAKAKRSGEKCMICGEPIWAIGTAIVGWNGCFSCISGEADDSEDFEIEGLC